jgi:peptide subunit release factor 1 (eRF1)
MSEQQAQNEAEKNIEIWKVKKLIKRLEQARGNGTSMISLIIRMCMHISTLSTSTSLTLHLYSPQGSSLESGKDVG